MVLGSVEGLVLITFLIGFVCFYLRRRRRRIRATPEEAKDWTKPELQDTAVLSPVNTNEVTELPTISQERAELDQTPVVELGHHEVIKIEDVQRMELEQVEISEMKPSPAPGERPELEGLPSKRAVELE